MGINPNSFVGRCVTEHLARQAGPAPAARRKRPPRPVLVVDPLIASGPGWLEVVLPHRLASRANSRGHTRHLAAGDAKIVRDLGTVLRTLPRPAPGPAGWLITMTRIAPRRLDERDNLRTALKAISDLAAVYLVGGRSGQRDEDGRLDWDYRQEPDRRYGVRVRIEAR